MSASRHTSVPRADFAPSFQSALFNMHARSAKEPIRIPSSTGVFPSAFLLRPPPVVLDSSRLRDDILYACEHDQRTTLVTAANAGLLRLFCAQHVVDEVAEHSGDWTERSGVPRTVFLRRWLFEYLPLVRVIPPDDQLTEMLGAGEAFRIQELAGEDPDDVPSATLSLLLEAFFLSNDAHALRAVYGPDADLREHSKWLQVLQAGGDAGELGRLLQLAINIVGLLGSGLTSGLKRLVRAAPWSIVPLGLLALFILIRTSEAAKEPLRPAGISAGAALL